MKIRRFATLLSIPVSAGVLIAGALAASAPPTSSQGPPAPLKLKGPPQTTANQTARFTWVLADAQTSAFRCQLDRGSFRRCTSGIAYGHLRRGRHTFTLVAIDAAGQRSAVAKGNAGSSPTSWSWTIVSPAKVLSIWGNVSSKLYPGASPISINPSLLNPHNYKLLVGKLTLKVGAVKAPHATRALPCTKADFATTNYRGHKFTVPSGQSTLGRDRVPKGQWPTISMIDRPVNQDGCMGATLTLAYQGSAIRRVSK